MKKKSERMIEWLKGEFNEAGSTRPRPYAYTSMMVDTALRYCMNHPGYHLTYTPENGNLEKQAEMLLKDLQRG